MVHNDHCKGADKAAQDGLGQTHWLLQSEEAVWQIWSCFRCFHDCICYQQSRICSALLGLYIEQML